MLPRENEPHRIAVGGLMLANSAPRKGLEKRQGWTPPRAFEPGCAWPRRRGALPQAAAADRRVGSPSTNRARAGPHGRSDLRNRFCARHCTILRISAR